METLKILISYFSDTGNTAKVALAILDQGLSERHEVHHIEIRKSSPEKLKAYDLIFMGAPCHDADLAGPIKQLLEQIPNSSTFKLAGCVTHESYSPDEVEREREVFIQ